MLLLNALMMIISACYDLSYHQVNYYLAFTLAAIYYWITQIFSYQLLICAIIRLGIVLHWELPTWSDDLVHKRIRIALSAFSLSMVALISFIFDFELPLAMILQGNDINLTVRIQHVLWVLALLVQLISRIIIRFKVGFENNEGPSKEVINTKTFLLMIVGMIVMQSVFHFGAIKSFQTAFRFVHCLWIILALQIIHHSQAMRQCFIQKFAVMPRLSILLEHAPRHFQNSVDPIYSVTNV